MIQLERNEKIIAIFRKHWFAILGEMLGIVIIALLPLVLFFAFYQSVFASLSHQHIYMLGFFYVLFLIFLWLAAFVVWINYYLDMWILTNVRLIDVEQHGLFSRDIASLHLNNIQDMKIEVHGIIQTLLKVGDIHIQTSAAQKEFIIRHADHPQRVKQLVMRVHTELLDEIKTVRIHQD